MFNFHGLLIHPRLLRTFMFFKRPSQKVREGECNINCSTIGQWKSRKRKIRENSSKIANSDAFLCTYSTDLTLHLLCAWACSHYDMHLNPTTTYFISWEVPNLEWDMKGKDFTHNDQSLFFVSPPENKGSVPRGGWATHSEQVWSQKSS